MGIHDTPAVRASVLVSRIGLTGAAGERAQRLIADELDTLRFLLTNAAWSEEKRPGATVLSVAAAVTRAAFPDHVQAVTRGVAAEAQ
jgi:hypothetical protein